MPLYIEILRAASETATKMLALRTDGTWYNVDVTTDGGKTASVTWNGRRVTLNMPSLPPTAAMTRGEADRLVAFIAHECCHVLHSDKNAWTDAVKAGRRVQHWTNALEDVRIEQKEINTNVFPALRSLLSAIANKLHYDAVTGKGGSMIGKQIVDAAYVSCILGRIANGYDIPAAANLKASCSPDVSRLVQHALNGVARCNDTADVLALALELVAMEQTLRKPAPPPPPSSDDDAGDDAPESHSDGATDKGSDLGGDDTGDDASSDPDAPDEPSEHGKPAGDDGEPGDDADAGAASDGEPPETDNDLTDMVKDIAKRNDNADTSKGNTVSQLNTVDNKTMNADRVHEKFNNDAINELKTRLTKNGVLTGQIGRLLVSQEQHRITHRETTGRLDRRAITRMQTDARDVFSKRHDTPGVNTALFILVDGSTSMRAPVGTLTIEQLMEAQATGKPVVLPTRMQVALTTAYHIAHAAEQANATVGAGVFTARGHGAMVRIMKPWQVSLNDAAATIANISFGGSTPLAPAIMESARLLSEQQATRRILMVLTDGECDYGAAAVKTACKLASDLHKVETVGVGMDCATVTMAFPPRYSINVADLTQLATKGLGVLCGMLESVGDAA